jgi:phosphatidylinositol-3-phosphatase
MGILDDTAGRGITTGVGPDTIPAPVARASPPSTTSLAPPAHTAPPAGPTHEDGGRSRLRHRRDVLAEQVTELHWDLGGLAYEMAIRDHFRLDVLVRRAAALQERDAELAEVERLLRLEESASAGSCPSCAAPHSRGALFCWQCGATLMECMAPLATVAPESQSGSGPTPGSSGNSALPSSRMWAVLVLMFLGFGVLLGGVVGSPIQNTLAASSGRIVKLILPPAVSAAAAGSTAAVSPHATNEPSPSPAEPTPEGPSSTSGSAAVKPGAGSSSPSSSAGGKTEGGGGKGGGGGKSFTPAPSGNGSKLPPIKHVFVIMLSDQPYASVFGPSSPSPYLSHTLEHRGELLVRYYAVAHQQLADGIALLSGQGPTPETAANCPAYSDVIPVTTGAEEQVVGRGCVYPGSTRTLPGQLTAKHLMWRAYLQGMDEPGASAGACAHPALGQPDPSSAQTQPSPPYATPRNPFVYFHALIDSPMCAAADVGLDRLAADIASPRSTPSFSYIVPDSCHDGSSTPCASGAPAGLGAAESFLKRVVPEITGSKAYKQNGLLAITVDEAPSSGELADSSSCCGQPQFPNMPASTTGLGPEGGGQVGALLLSPFIKSAGVSQEPYNHFSLLRTIEDLFGLTHLGYADLSKVSSFEPAMFSSTG